MSGCSWLDSSRARGGPASGLARMLGSGSQPSLEGVGSAFVAGLDVRTQSLPCRNGGAAHCTHDADAMGTGLMPRVVAACYQSCSVCSLRYHAAMQRGRVHSGGKDVRLPALLRPRRRLALTTAGCWYVRPTSRHAVTITRSDRPLLSVGGPRVTARFA